MHTDVFLRAHAKNVVKDNDAKRLARFVADTPDKQAAILIATKSIAQKTRSLERGLDNGLCKDTCSRADLAGLWMQKHAANIWQRPTKYPSSLKGAQVTASTSSHTNGCKQGYPLEREFWGLCRLQNNGYRPRSAISPKCRGRYWRTFPGRSGKVCQ